MRILGLRVDLGMQPRAEARQSHGLVFADCLNSVIHIRSRPMIQTYRSAPHTKLMSVKFTIVCEFLRYCLH